MLTQCIQDRLASLLRVVRDAGDGEAHVAIMQTRDVYLEQGDELMARTLGRIDLGSARAFARGYLGRE